MKGLWSHPQAGYILVALLTLAVYANSLDNPFLYDDQHSIVDNPHLRDLGRVPSYFIDPTAFSADPENAMYRPLLLTTFALNYAIGGYEVRGYHLFSLALHLGCALLVGAMTRQLLGGVWPGWLAAGLFALHPIHTESVNYISSRSEIQAAFFVLLGLNLYLRGGERRWLWVGLAYAAGLLSKSIAIVFPGVLIAYALGVRRRLPVEDKGFFALLAGIGALYVLAVWSFLAKATFAEPVRPFAEQFWTQIKAMVFYLKLLLWPADQSVDHQFLLSDTLFDPIAGSAACFLVSLVWLAIYHRRRHGVVLFGLAWFFIALAPASLVPLNVLVNEHRLYLPGAALALVTAYILLGLSRKIGVQWAGGLGLALLAVSGWATIERNEVWRDEYALWGDAAAKAPLMARPFIFLGDAYARDGRINEAIPAYEHVVRRDPNHAPAYAQLGKLYMAQGRDDLAVDILERGLVVAAENPALWVGLAEAQRGRRDWQGSLAACQRAVALAPEDAALHNNLGNTYQVLGRPQDAVAAHQRALVLVPGDAETLLNLGNALLLLEHLDQALDYYQQALAARADYAGAWFNLGYVHELRGEVDQALAAYARAVELDPGYAAQVAARRKAIEGDL